MAVAVALVGLRVGRGVLVGRDVLVGRGVVVGGEVAVAVGSGFDV